MKSFSQELPLLEYGRCMNVEICGDTAVKTSKYGTTPEHAASIVGQLERYNEHLRTEPVTVAPVQEIGTVNIDGRQHITMRMGLIRGAGMLRLPEEARHAAIATILRRISCMKTVDHRGTLKTPIDATSRNWHMNDQEPTLVDIYPPLARDENGEMTVVETRWTQGHWEKRYGTQQGVIGNILYSSLNISQGVSPKARLEHMLGSADDWCYDALPAGLSKPVRRSIERQVKLRFAPQIAGTLSRATKNKVVKPPLV